MTYAENLIDILNTLTEDGQKEVYDFAEYLYIKRKRNIEESMNK